MIYNLVDRAINLCNEKFHDGNIEKVKSLLKHNDYPTWFVEKFIKIRLEKLESGFKFIKNERSGKCIVLPYINGVFERVSSHLKDYLIDCVPKSNNELSYVIVKGKDKIKNYLKNNAVYKVDCLS